MRVRDGRTAAVPPSLAREGLELVVVAEPDRPRATGRARRRQAVADHAPDRVRLLGRDDPGDPRAPGARDVLPLHASTVRFSEQANRDEMMTPAGWAHLDYDGDEAEVQLPRDPGAQRARGRAVQPLRAVPDLARADRSSAGLPARDLRLADGDAGRHRPARVPRGHRRQRRDVSIAGQPVQRPPRVVVLPRPHRRRAGALRRVRLIAAPTLRPRSTCRSRT